MEIESSPPNQPHNLHHGNLDKKIVDLILQIGPITCNFLVFHERILIIRRNWLLGISWYNGCHCYCWKILVSYKGGWRESEIKAKKERTNKKIRKKMGSLTLIIPTIRGLLILISIKYYSRLILIMYFPFFKQS